MNQNNLWPEGWTNRTSVMGVINLTPDSFSDGGRYMEFQQALLMATKQINEGVDVIDLGAQSTRPGAFEVGVEEESRRLLPVLREIRAHHKSVLISVDTFLSKVASMAIEAGANWINDVSGARHDPDILKVVADAKCPYVLTHSRGNSKSMNSLASYDDVVNEVREELLNTTEIALSVGIKPANLIWDPGIGFAKTTEQNLLLLKGIEQIIKEGFPVLIGPSRKRFIGETLNKPIATERSWGTAAVICRCSQAKAAMVRVHEVRPTIETLKMAEVLW